MENATKALLIAAAVLIVIVIIALGVALLNPGSDMKGQAEAVGESTSVQGFNTHFSPYLGANKKASDVRALVTDVLASNKHNVYKVEVEFKSTKIIDKNTPTKVSDYTPQDAKTYGIVASYKGEGGRIDTITIDENNI